MEWGVIVAQVLKEEVKNRILEAATRPSCSYGIVWSVLGKMDRAANTTRCHQRNHQIWNNRIVLLFIHCRNSHCRPLQYRSQLRTCYSLRQIVLSKWRGDFLVKINWRGIIEWVGRECLGEII